ncbi:hypothetical protein BC941DRAFT_468014 [Chlamydoabsidia padenii]|nr:hypothetical protein BC941DRAFT_468014 [Chlamydoabsidia padenii]
MSDAPTQENPKAKNSDTDLSTTQIANKNKFVASPLHCKLFVEKLSPNQPGELRQAEILWARETMGNDQQPCRYEYYVHYVEFNKRLDEWVPFERKKRTPVKRGSASPLGQKRKLGAGDNSSNTPESEEQVVLGADDEDGDTALISLGDDQNHTFSKDQEIEKLRTSGSMTQCVSEIARVKNLDRIQMGKFEVEPWYFAPYPQEYAYCDTLYICEYCLLYYASHRQFERHRQQCQLLHPPGNEIYRHTDISFFEIDGRKQRTWCRNLCLLSKLFLDHKTLYYDVDPFLFYCMTLRDDRGCHLIGYFSKEKESSENYNVACILTLPQYQRHGFGKLLIGFSYLLSQAEGRTGSPEKPLSDLGLLSYRAYWKDTIVDYLLSAAGDVTIDDIAQHTSINTQDILHTLQNIGALRYYRGQHIICLGDKVIEQWERSKSKRKREIVPDKLDWKPLHFSSSQLRPWEKSLFFHSLLPCGSTIILCRCLIVVLSSQQHEMFATLELPIRDDSRHKRLQGGRACHQCRMKKVKCDGKQPCMQILMFLIPSYNVNGQKCKARRRKCMFLKNPTDTYIRMDDSLIPGNDNDSNMDVTNNDEQRQRGREEYLFANGKGAQSKAAQGNGHLDPFTRTEKLVEQLTDGLTRLALNQQEDRSTLPTGPSTSPQASKPINNNDTITPWLNFGDFVRWAPELYPPTNYSVLLDMPSRAIQEQLISTFFSHCHHLLPTISRRLFYDQLEIKGPLITPLLLNIMYAHAAKHTSHSSKPFYTRARQLVDDFIDTPRISTVMALLYLAAFDDGTWSSRCWMYSGMAVRMALDLGLYKANYYSNEMSQFDVELRKRVLWTSYVMDQLYSTLMERPPMLATDIISLDLPTPLPEDNDQERLAVTALSQLCRLVMILEKVVRYFTTRNSSRQQQQSERPWEGKLLSTDDGDQVMTFLNNIKYWHNLLPHTLTWYDDDNSTMTNNTTNNGQHYNNVKYRQHQHWAVVNLHLLAFVLELSLLLCCQSPLVKDRELYLVKSISRLVSWTLQQPHLQISMTLTAFSGLFCTSTLLSHYSVGIIGSNNEDKHNVMESVMFRQCLLDVRHCLQRIPARDAQHFSLLVDSIISPQSTLSDSTFGGATLMDATMKAAAAAVVTATGVVGGDHDLDLISMTDPYFGQYQSSSRPKSYHQPYHQQHNASDETITTASNYTLMMPNSSLSHIIPSHAVSPILPDQDGKTDSSSPQLRNQQRLMNSSSSTTRSPFGLPPPTTISSSTGQQQQNHHHSIEPADYTFELISVADEWARTLTYETHQMDGLGKNNSH